MPAEVQRSGSFDARPPAALRDAQREAERQLEWAEAYLGAVEGIDTGDPEHAREARRLRLEAARLRAGLRRPRVL